MSDMVEGLTSIGVEVPGAGEDEGVGAGSKRKLDYDELLAKIVELDARNVELDARNVELEAQIVEKKARLVELDARNVELDAQNVEEKARLVELDAQQKVLDVKSHLVAMAAATDNFMSFQTSDLEISASTQQKIDSVQIDDAMEEKIALILRSFKEHGKEITDRSYSVGEPNSVHYLWKRIFQTIQEFLPGKLKRRIAYEWKMYNPIKYSFSKSNSIDFAFLPIGDNFDNWHTYGGGVEVTRQSKSASSSDTDSTLTPISISSSCSKSSVTAVVTDGMRQALSHAAKCVYDRWNDAKRKGSFRAYCCFADSLHLGLIRVTLDGDTLQVTVEVLPMKYLIGVKDEIKGDINLLRLLIFLLTSDSETLIEFITPPKPNPQIVGSGYGGGAGGAGGGGGSEDLQIIWKLGVYLGAGSSAAVYRDLEHPSCVIKIPHDITNRESVNSERKTLDVLHRENVRFVPQVEGLLENCLKLSPLGIPVSSYVRFLASELPDGLIRLMGPALVSTLQHVHSLGIAHLDIRRPNILIVPPAPADKQNDYISLMRELNGVEKLLDEIKLADCSFYLNDWGAAIHTQDKRFFRKDLKMLVGALLNVQIEDDLSSSRASSDRKEPVMRASGGGGGNGGEDDDTLDDTELTSRFALSLDYANMSSFFSNFRK